jgi:phosphoribosylpyrophosphate synthetase
MRHLKQKRGEALADAVIVAPDLGASKYAGRFRKAVGSRYPPRSACGGAAMSPKE